mgnify:CR=1 FL=1
MAQPQEFPFNIMDVAELLHLHIRRRQADSVYADCPICGDKRGKMNINFAKNLWRCNYCNEGGGMLSLYGKVYGISNSEAYREICDTLQNGLTAPEYTAKVLPEQAAIEQSALASPQEIHQTFSMLLELLTLTPQHRKHLHEVRGLTDEQIERLGYKSTPPFYLCRSLAQKLRSRGCKVEGVPGFYVGKDDKWTVNFNSITAGIIIPARGIDGMIRGAQIRLDTPIRDQESDPDKSGTKYLWLSSSSKKRGVSSGSPVHFVGDPFARVVYVTEGLLKADVPHYLMDRSFAATAGANNVNKLDMLFALLAANGTEVIIEAEDMDKYHNAAVIKSHHNVGGLPDYVDFKEIIEPLRMLFKDEVRQLGFELGLSEQLVMRQPFPGPGLAIRIIGEITEEKLAILREADAIIRYEIGRSSSKANQYFGVLTNLRSVGVMGDERTYDYTLALRAVTTGDFMTCQYTRLPHSLLSRISTRITNEVRGINRVVFDITDKPPATIEWE